MRKTIDLDILTKVTDDILCNICGKSTKKKYGFSTVELSVKWGYHSTKDGQYHESHLCETCYDNLVSQYQIPVTIKEYIIGTGAFIDD